ncbi:hypothetical protein LRP50_00195 [Enterovibrio sp. ZSDZ42]|uniref:Transmembrane protein n=1 Tax=Enterovibrio gelatinilyticus TaxID=2899819 RepID=A0ABT5QW64_9GAMM|nr:hypothetical protein [Enterovibrio sp. ZSDZ42]MDD1791547.1 hypothetical protein [Enterovibrio sp. ZSDZ42]
MRDKEQVNILEGIFSFKPPNSYFWKIFFFVFVYLEVTAVVGAYENQFLPEGLLLLEILTYGYLSIGLFGYAFWKPIFTEKVWRQALPIFAIYEIFAIISLIYCRRDYAYSSYFLENYAFTFVTIYLPLSYALYRYGFKSPRLWANR